MTTNATRSRQTRTASGVLAIAVLASLAGAGIGPAAAKETAKDPVPKVETPSARAAKTGQRVELPDRTTELSQTFVNPNGTFTYEQSIMPVRTKRDGKWIGLDATLERSADGMIRPRAASVQMAFSAGGSGPLVAMKDADGGELKFSWPGELPKPDVKADTLTYRSVLPDVDLKITVSTSSFTEVLVVHTPEAADLPALRKITFGMHANGVAMRKTRSGGFEALDRFGRAIFSGPQPTMWDSRGSGRSEPAGSDRAEAPLEGDEVRPMPLDVAGKSISITPSASLADDPKTVYPIYIDPPAQGAASGRAMINERYAGTSTWNWTNPEGMGYQSFEPWSRKRLFYQFLLPTNIYGAKIKAATMSVFETFAASCTPKTVQVWKTIKFSDGITWNNGSGSAVWQKHLSSATVAHGRDGCEPGGSWVTFPVGSAVGDQVGAGARYVYFGLRAADETDELAWKRWRNDARLSIDYNHLPSISNRKFTEPEAPCASNIADYPIVPTRYPIPEVVINDNDQANQSVAVDFEVYLTGTTEPVWGSNSVKKVPGSRFTPQLVLWNRGENVPLLNNKVYAWRARAWDGIDYSAWTSYCYFMMDSSKPASPTIEMVTPGPYRVGQTLTAKIVPHASDVVSSKYALNDDAPGHNASGASPTFTFVPDVFGPGYTLRAWSVDNAGNASSYPGSLSINIENATEIGRWAMDEGSGNTTADLSGKNHPLVIATGVTWSNGNKWLPAPTGPNDFALKFSGNSTTAQTGAGNIVNTRQNYSVTARVRPGTQTARQVVVSEDSPGQSAFTLGILSYDAVAEQAIWGFTVPDPDGSGEIQAKSTPMSVDPGEWVHLSGIYDAGSRTMRLYVDDILVATVPVPGTLPTIDGNAAFRIGHGMLNNAYARYFTGDIEDVRIYAGAIDHSVVNTLQGEPK
ncbi:LamG domain-containing protein [Kribbella antibiotica]|uniref:LamG domain-containing protein n=1 Tax=Kribbella antibiotica TaxID=190195 RepID=A0A4R4ZQX7_9ACTN|nr:LamG-like jellyroll fold domain-containing protein [Kribbella antibiotica]TDD61353.1 LamG domain-containing protein [Kribbella antibiotica]